MNLKQLSMHPDLIRLLGIAADQLPLKNNLVYSGSNLNQASTLVGSIANQARHFRVIDKTSNCAVEIFRVRLSRSQIGLTYNSHAMQLETDDRTKTYTLIIPLSGSYKTSSQIGEFVGAAPIALFNSAKRQAHTLRSDNYLALILSLNPGAFEVFSGGDLDAWPDHPYSIQFDLTEPRFHRFCGILGTLLKVLEDPSSEDSQQDMVISRLEDAMWYQFFISCVEVREIHEKSQGLETASASIRKAVEYIETNLAEEIDVKDLVKITGFSTRSLYYGFHESFDCGPMQYIRKLRLEKCHKQLLEADSRELSVTDVASEWGFFHLSNFSKNYRDLYGELPSETLKRPVIKAG